MRLLLTPEQRQHIRAKYALVFPLIASGRAFTVEIAARVHAAIKRCESLGCAICASVLDQYGLAGVHTDGKIILNEQTYRVPTRSGDSLTIRRFLGKRQRADDGTPISIFEQSDWLDWPWAEIIAKREEISRERDIRDRQVEVLSVLLDLREKHPNAKTPREVYEAEGFDVGPFDQAVGQ